MAQMSVDEKLAERFIDGETLQGEEAEQIRTELKRYGAWRLYVIVALAYLREGRAAYAEHVLTELMENYKALDLG